MLSPSDIAARAAEVLHDTGSTRWSSSELIKWVSDGQQETVNRVPNACPTTETFSLSAGRVQSLPANTVLLLDVLYNIETGHPIHQVDRSVFDIYRGVDEEESREFEVGVEMFYYDPTSPKKFMVYPAAPSSAPGSVMLSRSVMPAAFTSGATALQIEERFVPALLDYTLSRAFAKDSEDAEAQSLAKLHFERWVAALKAATSGN